MRARMHDLLFVGVSRAIRFLFMSGTNGRPINPLIELGQRDTGAFLETQLAAGAGGMFTTLADSDAASTDADDFGLD